MKISREIIDHFVSPLIYIVVSGAFFRLWHMFAGTLGGGPHNSGAMAAVVAVPIFYFCFVPLTAFFIIKWTTKTITTNSLIFKIVFFIIAELVAIVLILLYQDFGNVLIPAIGIPAITGVVIAEMWIQMLIQKNKQTTNDHFADM